MRDFLLYLFGLPGIFVVLFLILCFYLYTRQVKKAKFISVIILVAGWFFSNQVVGGFFASILIENVTYRQINSLKDIDMIVVPTQGIEYQGEHLGWMPNVDSYKAGIVAYDFQSRLVDMKVPVLICGGKIEGGADIAESKVIKSYFARQSAQIKKTITEDISKNLYEQVWQCSATLKHYNAKNPVLIIDELKMFRTLALFRSRGMEMVPFPVFVVSQEQSSLRGLLPSLQGLMLNRAVFTEAINLLLDLVNQKISIADLSYKGNIN